MTAAIGPPPNEQLRVSDPSLQSVLKQVFGFDSFRKGQEETIERLLAGKSVLAVFPTGSGKSLCYQLPALMLDGLTVVISPLIALMKDQIDSLRAKNVPAARIDSSLSHEETLDVYRQLRSGQLRILFVSPERLANERFLHFVSEQNISLLTVDEAHCISQWGHNFRPDYLRVAGLADRLRAGRVLALTATATPQVAADIACSFDIEAGDVVQTGFYRPNLELRISACRDSEREELLCRRLKERPAGPTVVYVTLQRTAARIAAFLASRGFAARPYHAGLKTEERNEVQDEFMDSDSMIVVATIAFGMGIDKANIRAVYHYNIPKSLESYMQEIGRAGRDGQAATCEMFACADDVVTLENFSYGDTPTTAAIESMVKEILQQGTATSQREFDLSIHDLCQRHDVRELVVKTLLTYLELDGVIEPTGHFYSQFKFQPLRSSQEILAKFDPRRRSFLEAMFRSAKKGRSRFSLDVDSASHLQRQPRERFIKALNYLEQQKDISLQATGVRQGFRLKQVPTNQRRLVESLSRRFADREQQDIERVAKVIELAEHPGCLTEHLLGYFGESLKDCGHCDRCLQKGSRGKDAYNLPPPCRLALNSEDEAAVRRVHEEGHAALAAPRQMTRFLCGITSPATTRAKLRKHQEFGRLDRVSFSEVLEIARSVVG